MKRLTSLKITKLIYNNNNNICFLWSENWSVFVLFWSCWRLGSWNLCRRQEKQPGRENSHLTESIQSQGRRGPPQEAGKPTDLPASCPQGLARLPVPPATLLLSSTARDSRPSILEPLTTEDCERPSLIAIRQGSFAPCRPPGGSAALPSAAWWFIWPPYCDVGVLFVTRRRIEHVRAFEALSYHSGMCCSPECSSYVDLAATCYSVWQRKS